MRGLFAFSWRPLLTAFLLGLLGFIGSWYSLNERVGSHVISINWAFLFPLLASMAYGPRYAFVAGVLGFAAFYPFFLWPTNGWANISTVLTFLSWYLWQGWCAVRREKKPSWWNHPLVAQLFYSALFIFMIFVLYPPLFALNPPPWRPDAPTSIPASVLKGIVFKELILTWLAVLVVASLLKSTVVRRGLGLPVPDWARFNDRIILASLLGSFVVMVFHTTLTGVLIHHDFPEHLVHRGDSQNLIDLLILLCIGFLTAYVVILAMERRLKAEAAVARSRELLRSTLLSMDDLVFTLSRAGILTQYHQPAQWPQATPDAVGRPYAEVLPPELCRSMEPLMPGIFAGAGTRSFTYGHAAPGGMRWFSAKLSCHRAPSGAEHGLTAVVRDVTAQKKLEEQLRHTQKMEALGNLASGIAHDFNNLLAPIGVLIPLAETYAGQPAKLSDALGRIREATQRASELAKLILNFGRKSVQNPSPTPVAPVLEECMKLMRATIPAGVEVHLELHSRARVKTDSIQLYQIIMNLCTNAFQAMERRGGSLAITLADGPAGSVPATVTLSFQDTGEGIPEAILPRIFEPYFTTKEPGKGTGLGLPVVHGIVESMEGAITVASEPGKGTRFVITLPSVAGE